MKLIKQKRNDDCVLCCVAMVAGVSYKKARKAFDDKPPYSFIQECKALVRLGLFPDYRNMLEGCLYGNRLQIITVPSLNQIGINHRIVVDTRVYKTTVYDPLENVKNKKFYSSWDDVKAFSEVLNIIDTKQKGGKQ